MKNIPQDLPSFLSILEKEGELAHITTEVDPHLELAEVHRQVVAKQGKCLLFHTVKGSRFPVVTNLFGTQKRVELAFPGNPELVIKKLIELVTERFPPSLTTLWQERHHLKRLIKIGRRHTRNAPVLACTIDPPNLEEIPLLTCWPDDGGRFMTLPLVYTEPPPPLTSPPNLGMYRIQRFDAHHTGLHFQIGKGGGFHYQQAEQLNTPLPVTIFLGGPPALLLSAIAPLPENVPELLLASLLLGNKIPYAHSPGHPHPIIASCEFAICGHAKPHIRAMEGPFGDHYGYYGLAHEYPVFNCDKIYHKKDAIYPATVVGKPVQEDLFIGNFLQELFSPLIKVIMPEVKALWSYGEAGFHPLTSAIVSERYEKEALSTAFRILGEGQLRLTKFLILTDVPVDLRSIRAVLEAVLSRFRPERDLYIITNTANDTLDYTGPSLNLGSKAILLGLGKEERRKLPTVWHDILPRPLVKALAFCSGCLLLQGPKYSTFEDPSSLLQHAGFANWPLLILVDDAETVGSSELEFLWTVFTRFEPARDMYMKETTLCHHHLSYKTPILIDARMKPSYPKEVMADADTIATVKQKWGFLCGA